MTDKADRARPYPGLRAFEPEEDLYFFGRQKQTDDLLCLGKRLDGLLALSGTPETDEVPG